MKAVFLQARLDSTRLPMKALLPLEGIPLVGWAMGRLKKIEADRYVLLTCEKDGSTLEEVASLWGFEVFTGSQEDVLDRFSQGVKKYQPQWVFRATADNPFVSPTLATETFQRTLSQNKDYGVLKQIPLGSSVEVVRATALLKAAAEAADSYEREHVTPYLYRHPETFAILEEQQPPEGYKGDFSVTVDTIDDFKRVVQWAQFKTPGSFSLKDLIEQQQECDSL